MEANSLTSFGKNNKTRYLLTRNIERKLPELWWTQLNVWSTNNVTLHGKSTNFYCNIMYPSFCRSVVLLVHASALLLSLLSEGKAAKIARKLGSPKNSLIRHRQIMNQVRWPRGLDMHCLIMVGVSVNLIHRCSKQIKRKSENQKQLGWCTRVSDKHNSLSELWTKVHLLRAFFSFETCYIHSATTSSAWNEDVHKWKVGNYGQLCCHSFWRAVITLFMPFIKERH